jgi:asparagine synthase (glutamine-hydrolysing)
MCGIVGIVKLDPRERVDADRLRRMRDVLRHRGPDGEGLFIEGPVGLGHRRLAIVDVAGGAQPMAAAGGGAVIAYNGEVYDHPRHKRELEARGRQYRTRSDTETILHLYDERGERCVESLQGMFAFALWDRTRRRLLLARDRLGIKPLYYALTSDELLFASEVKAILAALPARPALNRAVVPELLAKGFVAGEETLFQGVRRLRPGRTLTWDPASSTLEQRRYWRIPDGPEPSPPPLEECAAEVRDRLRAAVSSHLMSDVPLGLFLSGGIDSSGLLGLMAPLVPGRVRTFAVGFAEREANELEFARLAARRWGAEHREVVVSPSQFFEALPRLVWHEDEPIAFPSSVPLYFVSRLARDHVKVVLTGEGADELFLGYNRYRVTAWNERLGRPYWKLVPGPARRGMEAAVARLPRALRRYAERSFLALPPGPRGLFCENFAVFPQSRQAGLLADPGLLMARDPYAEELRAYEEAAGGPLDRMSRVDLQIYLVRLLMKQDQMSMAASIESRVPFLDHELVERVAALPGSLKLRGLRTKAVLRSALRDVVPAEILTRRKMGFPVPVGHWLRGPFWPVVQEFVLGPRALTRGLLRPQAVRRLAEQHRRGEANHGDRLWLLVNLEIWGRVFLDGEDTASVMKAAA